MKTVSISDAKNNFSALIDSAINDEPQLITINGAESAVLISYKVYLKLMAGNPSFVDCLLDSPLRNSKIDLSRSKAEDGRNLFEFDED